MVSNELKNKLSAEVNIERIDFELFNQLIIKDIYLEDQEGDTLFYAKRLAAGFELLPLLKGELRFSSAQLFSFHCNLYKNTDKSPLNIQFILDAFASNDTISNENNINLQIKTLNLRRGSFSYRVKNAGKTPGKFNMKDIDLYDISSKIHLNQLTENDLDANIERLSFKDKSGFEFRNLHMSINAGKEKTEIKDFELQLKNSLLQFGDIKLDYKNTDQNNFLSNSDLLFEIKPSSLVLQDISPFLPFLSDFRESIILRGDISGNIKELTLHNFQLANKNNLSIDANLIVRNLDDKDKLYVEGAISNTFVSSEGVKMLINNIYPNQEKIPENIYQLGNIRFEGDVKGLINDLTAIGRISTDIGSIRTDISIGTKPNLSINGEISSNGLDLKKLLLNNDNFGNASFNIKVNAIQNTEKKIAGKIDAGIGRFEFKKHTYEDIRLTGDFTNESFSGVIDIDSPEGQLHSEGYARWADESSEFNFYAEANKIKLDQLNLSKKYKDSELSMSIDANFSGNNIDNLLGYIHLNNLRFSSEKGGYYLDTVAINVIKEENEKILNINSDLIHGEIRGNYSFDRLIPSFKGIINNYLPAIFPENNYQGPNGNNIFSIELIVEDLEEFSYIFDLPFSTYNKSKIVGQYNSIYEKFRLEAYFPKFNFRKYQFNSGRLIIENPGKEINLTLNAVNIQKNNKEYLLGGQINIAEDSIHSIIKWHDNVMNNYQGGLVFSTKLFDKEPDEKMKLRINIEESNVTFNDSTWTLYPSTIDIDSGKITIDNLTAEHSDQHIKIDGTISNEVDDKLWVNLNKVDLKYIFNTLAIEALTFGGIASGNVEISDLSKTRQLSTNLFVKDFSFNNVVFGDLDLNGSWDNEHQGVLMSGDIVKNDSSGVKVDGIIFPMKSELSINFDAKNADAAFLRKYLDNVATGISGEITGNIRLFGTFSDVTLEGNPYVRNGSFGINFLNTRYSFSDTVKIKPDEFAIENIILKDKFGNTAIASGSVRHNFLEDFTFNDILIQTNNFLVFDANERQNSSFYGTAFGTGSAVISGNEQLINISVSMLSNRNTKITLNLMEEQDIAEYDFINFVTNKKQDTTIVSDILPFITGRPILLQTESKTEIRFNFSLEATPDATIELIMDPVAGDRIKGYGRGNLKVEYGTKSPLKIYGNYAIENGSYNFSLQQVIYRDFTIREGSTVSFSGDPYKAQMNVVAVYSLSAYLGDLDDQLIAETSRTNVLVNCVLGISGEMAHPNITFDLELPNSNEALERQVKSIINTDDMMNRQIVYLLVLNKFYTIQDNQSSGAYKTNDLSSLASATLSSQLSNILGAMSENIQIGTRIKTTDGDFTDTEVALLLSSQLLDNRLIFNGNFGYRENPNLEGKSNFIGDFDIEYKLTRSGEIRLKAYNHYSDNYYNLKTRTTQGVGIMFKKDFDKIGDLFFRRKKLPEPFPIPYNTNDTVPISFRP